eukprot:CAMPEP_0167750960 /NCGR_PEP_ID=MMETSP0110_2-20121227/6287_1 /TAXON_ID=629695 /ORGANISM="Gymnochlora sp., Strain CCMP2014" /LENGTH=424 /DNA_ID=CAMNT_0007636351 /DNA_START=94 /DNA_END=1368 /DNA_ORIENTATION=+
MSSINEVTRPKVVVISGPTAVGKSRLAEELCVLCGGEIISADSVQVYRGMDIGSAKPDMETQEKIVHHLIDTRHPSEEYNAALFAEEAHEAISKVLAKGRVPVVVGGTGFYIEWLLYGKAGAPAPTPEAAERAQLEVESFNGDWEKALSRVAEIDPRISRDLETCSNNWYRLKRALEIFYTDGKPQSEYKRVHGKAMNAEDINRFRKESIYDYRCYFLTRNREELFRSIDLRCEKMLHEGFLEEVIGLVEAGALKLYRENPVDCTPAERSIGYRQALELICRLKEIEDEERDKIEEKGDIAITEFLRNFTTASRQFAQRQLKQFRREPMFNWINYSPKLPHFLLEELDKSSEDFWKERIGEKFLDPSEEEAVNEPSQTGRFMSKEEQKIFERSMKTYISKLNLLENSNARTAVFRKLEKLVKDL